MFYSGSADIFQNVPIPEWVFVFKSCSIYKFIKKTFFTPHFGISNMYRPVSFTSFSENTLTNNKNLLEVYANLQII